MAGRYSQWRSLRGDLDRPELVDYGKRLLAYLDTQRKLSGVKTMSISRQTLDGSTVRASFFGDQPRIEILAAPEKPQSVQADLAGFVLWPSSDDGSAADPLSPRVILRKQGYKAATKEFYSRLFPDYDDVALGLVDGLGRAGNVDWHGDDGWAVSWYGPRSRYIDYDCPLSPYVFFKGRPVLSADDYITSETNVIGAAVCKLNNSPWLVVVSEDYRFGHFEDVWAVPIKSKATDSVMVVGAPAEGVLLFTRTKDESGTARHPVLFNPAGTEGRRITDGDSNVLEEHVFRIVSATDATFEIVPIDACWYQRFTGYSAGINDRPDHTFKLACHASSSTDISTLAPTYAAPVGTQVTAGFPLDLHIINHHVLLGGDGLRDWVYQEEYVLQGDTPWQPIAVDFTEAGVPTYAYGRIPGGSRTRSGTKTHVLPADFTPTLVSTSGVATFQSRSASTPSWDFKWNGDGICAAQPTVGTGYGYTSTSTTAFVNVGIRLGAVEVLAETTGTASAEFNNSDTTNSLAPTTPSAYAASGGWFSPGVTGVYPDFAANTAHAFTTGFLRRHVVESGSTTNVETAVDLYLVFMDLRADALFVASVERTLDSETLHSHDMAVYDRDVNPVVRAGSTDTTTTRRTRWRVRGWISGTQVLDHDVLSRDETTVLSAPISYTGSSTSYTPKNYGMENPTSWPDQTNTTGTQPYPDYPGGRAYTPDPWNAPSAMPPALAYSLTSYGYPAQLNYTMVWNLETDRNATTGTGTTYTPEDRVKLRWKADLDGVWHNFGYAFYKGAWAVSISLPVKETDAFLFFSACGKGAIAPLVPITAEHYFPIWTLKETALR